MRDAHPILLHFFAGNRDQVRDGARILGFLVPIFVDLMMDNPDENWGLPYYPVVEREEY